MCNKERVLTSICMKAFQRYLRASDFVRASVCTLGLGQDIGMPVGDISRDVL